MEKRWHIRLPESKFQALQKLKCIAQKCRLNKGFVEEYCQKIRGYKQKGYVRTLSAEAASARGTLLWKIRENLRNSDLSSMQLPNQTV